MAETINGLSHATACCGAGTCTTSGCGGPGWNSSCLPVVMGCVPFIIDREVRDLPQMALERHCVLFTLVNMRLRARQEVGKTGYAVCGLTIRINMRLRARSKSEKGVNLSLQFGGAWFYGTINLKGGSGFFFFAATSSPRCGRLQVHTSVV